MRLAPPQRALVRTCGQTTQASDGVPSLPLGRSMARPCSCCAVDTMMKYMGLKLGPAPKLCYHIDRLKQGKF